MNKILFRICLLLVFIFSVNFVRAEGVQCLDLSSDLKSGTSGTSVTMLQKFLSDSGYLKATPNGYFGISTLSAVKSFQVSANLPSTGYVGSMTRSAIKQKTCISVATPVAQPSVTPVVSNPVASIEITTPATGQTLTMGSSITIRWSRAPAGAYNIVLEQPGGSGAGFVTTNLSGASVGQYTWNVGNIFSSQTNTNETVAVGTYRLRIQRINDGSNPSDVMSGWFTLVPPQFGVSEVRPSRSPADNATAVVLFGTGFTQNGNSVYFDFNQSGVRANTLYVSPDGSVLVFTVPTTISVGTHTLFINNASNSSTITMPFTVVAAP